MLTFLEDRRISVSGRGPRALSDVTHQELTDKHVIVCLDGEINEFLDVVPFHTAVLSWDMGEVSDVENLYRELAPRIRDLIELMRGEGAD